MMFFRSMSMRTNILVIAMLSLLLSTPYVFGQPSQSRFAVFRFDGKTMLPTANQFSIDPPKPPSLESNPSELVEAPALLVLAADLAKYEIWLYAKVSLWNLSESRLSSESIVICHSTHNSHTVTYGDKTRPQKDHGFLWNQCTTALFVDPFHINLTDDITATVLSIQNTCGRKHWSVEPKSEFVKNSHITRTCINSDQCLVVNHWQAGSPVNANFLKSTDVSGEFLVSAALYAKDKPIEFWAGILSTKVLDKPPMELAPFMDEIRLRTAETKSNAAEANAKAALTGPSKNSAWMDVFLFGAALMFIPAILFCCLSRGVKNVSEN